MKKSKEKFFAKAITLLRNKVPTDTLFTLLPDYDVSKEEIITFIKAREIKFTKVKALTDGEKEIQKYFNMNFDIDFIAEHSNIVLLRRGENNEFYKYTGGVYLPISGTEMYDIVDSCMIEHSLFIQRTSKRKVEDTIQRIASRLSSSTAFFSEEKIAQQKYYLNVKNGLFNIKEKKLLPHTPDHFSTSQVPFSYDPEVKCPEFEKFIEEVSDKNLSTTRMIQEMFGYCLSDGNPKHRVFYLYGVTARNGKSTVAKIIMGLLGTDNVSTLSLDQLAGENSSLLTSLIDKQLNYSDELSAKFIDSPRLTAMSSESFVEINPKFKKAFLYQVKSKFIITCNDLPRFRNSQGMKTRMISIPFGRYFKEKDRIEHLEEILIKKEGSGILNWALAGLDTLKKNKVFFINEESKEDMKENLHQSNPTYAFLELNYDFDPSFDLKYTAEELYGEEEKRTDNGISPATAFRLFHKEHGIRNLSFFVFAKELSRFAKETRKIKKIKIRGTRYYVGLQPKKEKLEEPEESIIQKEFNNL